MTSIENPPGLPTPTPEERNWAMFGHLSALLAFVVPPIGGLLGPLVIWLVKREQSEFVADQAKEALNFNITIAIAAIACVILTFILIGALLGVIVGLYWLVMTIIAAMKANEGVAFRYPYALRLVK